MKKYPKKTLTLKFPFSFALIVVALFIYSCRKEAHNQNILKTNTVAIEMKNWLNSQNVDTLTRIAVNKYLNNIQWEQAVSLTGDSSTIYDLVPVKIDTVAKFDDAQLTLNKYLILTKVKDNITGSALANVVGNKADTESFPALIVNFTHDKQGSFTGTISLGNITGVFKESKTYELGTMTRHSVLQTRNKSTNKTIQSTNGKVLHDCSAYYLVTYDQYGGTISEEYLFTVCDGNACNTTAIFGRKATLSLVLNCGGGGGGSGDVPETVTIIAPNPVKPCALKFKNITSSYMAVAVTGYKFGIADNVFGTKFITFNVQIGLPSYVNIQKAQNATAAAMQLAEATIAQTHGVDFFLSAGAQGTYSKEFANLVQEQLRIVLGAPVDVTNAISAGVPIITYADNNCD